jgi:flagellar biosynthesis protein FlhG
MLDQADHLRLLMRGVRRAGSADGAPCPRLLVFVGGKGGVGTTSIAVNFAVGLASQGCRTLLVDGDLGKCDAAALCGTREGYTLGDVLAGRRHVQQALHRGPAGIQILPGAWATAHITDCDHAALDRLLAELSALHDIDQVVIDAGCGVNRVVERFWKSADRVLLVTTADSTAVMDAYAALKTVGSRQADVPVQVVMNKVADSDAQGAFARLAAVCWRFLRLQLNCAASIPYSHEIIAAARLRMPLVLSSPRCQTTQIIDELVRTELKSRHHEKTKQLIHAVHAEGPITMHGVGHAPTGKL